ncbi:MAG: GspH/FimT family pseudopilin [Myxococcales bacterium]|nr:GspH/FimT family pseudopilin [Myxococcales bacterium]
MRRGDTNGTRSRGFTLVELMAVVATIGILAAIALPNFQIWIDHQRMNAAAGDIAGTLQLARLKAVNTSKDVYIDFAPVNGASDRFFTAYVDTDGNGAYDAGEELVDDVAMDATLGGREGVMLRPTVFYGVPAGVTRDPLNQVIVADGIDFGAGQNDVRFRRNGTANSGFVFLRNARDEAYAVEVNAVGKVRVWRRVQGAWR